MFEPDANPDYMEIIGDLMKLTDANVDFVHLNHGGPVIRERPQRSHSPCRPRYRPGTLTRPLRYRRT